MLIITKPILIQDLGQQYPTEKSKRKYRFGLYRCECGVEFKSQTSAIKIGNTKSCGCYNIKKIKEANTNHGLAAHRLYKIWSGMIRRTTNKNHEAFKYYGGRGITVCDRWLDLANFIEDMYPSYQEGLSIDRIDNNKGYSLYNCRWTTQIVQMRNTTRLMSTNTSGFRGVCFVKSKNKWKAQISIDSKSKHLGYFQDKNEAAKAYDDFVTINLLEHTKNF